MADLKTTNFEKNNENGISEAQVGTISLEDIDKFLEESDPAFSMSLADIVPEELKTDAEISSLDLDEKALIEDDDQKEKKKSFLDKYPKVQTAIAKGLVPIKGIPTKSRTLVLKLRNEFLSVLFGIWSFCRHGLPDSLRYLLGQIKATIAYCLELNRRFWAKTWKEKVLYGSALVFFVGFSSMVAKNMKGRWLPSLFLDYTGDLGLIANRVRGYDDQEQILLSDAFPQPFFTVLLEKIVLNLRKTSEHQNPMGAFKFYVRVDSQETAVEVKDRQIELLDSMQRALEELTYEEANGPGGKTTIKSLVRNEINRVLSQGRALEIDIEMMITKP